jgi:hypothetical protein
MLSIYKEVVMDLYNIPGDTGGDWRMRKLLDYKYYVPYVDMTTIVGYAKMEKLSKDDAIMLAWYHSVAYNEVTAIFLLETLDWREILPKDLRLFTEDNLERMEFTSSRIYVKNCGWFIPIMSNFMKTIKRQPYRTFVGIIGSGTPEENYRRLYKEVASWKYMGRFSTELFLLVLIELSRAGILDFDLKEPGFFWGDGSNVTSGMLNCLYLDELANDYDKTKKLDKNLIPHLDQGLVELQELSAELYPDMSYEIADLLPRVCAYRNLFKCLRYPGFHHDRQLATLIKYENNYPDLNYIWEDIYNLRRKIYIPEMLGEIGGWDKVRPERKKLFISKGVLGIEKTIVSKHKRL